MKYVIDTEFDEDGRTIDLISIGIAAADGRTYYAISNEFDPSKVNEFVRAEVLPNLHAKGDTIWLVGRDGEYQSPAWKSRAQIRDDILEFVGDDAPEFWAYFADYDWIALCQLFGTMMDLPDHFPKYCRDIKQLADDMDMYPIPVPVQPLKHHALADAVWGLEALNYLQLHAVNTSLRWVRELRAQVGNYAMAMENNLRQYDYKGGWDNEDPISLFSRLNHNVLDLLSAIEDSDQEWIIKQALDAGAYCMMLFDQARLKQQAAIRDQAQAHAHKYQAGGAG